MDRETLKCSMCRKRFFEDGFKVNRFGRRLRTCLECNERGRARPKCRHGKRDTDCVDCHGANLCHHNRQRQYCYECHGAGLCPHGSPRHGCRRGCAVLVCHHLAQKSYCLQCLNPDAPVEAPKTPTLTDDEVTEVLAGLGI